jgi:hypothetical protein
MRTFGRQTLTFVSVAEDTDNRDRYGNPAIVRTETEVPGCRFRPLTATETAEDGTVVVKDQWRATCPPMPAVVSATSRDEIKADGVTYQIVGLPLVFVDLAGEPCKVTVNVERLCG